MSELKLKHCTEALDREIVVGSTSKAGKDVKRFVFHVLENEYRVQVKKYRTSSPLSHKPEAISWKTVDSGQAVEELLEVYNEL
jgi:hypothetical protein